jgi:hypothetical protein
MVVQGCMFTSGGLLREIMLERYPVASAADIVAAL